jgi:hypothetical protein
MNDQVLVAVNPSSSLHGKQQAASCFYTLGFSELADGGREARQSSWFQCAINRQDACSFGR